MPSTERSSTNALRRIPTTTLCSDWGGSTSLTTPCQQNTGLAQHQVVLVPSASMTGTVLVSIRPADCDYFVPVGVLALPGNLVFRGVLDAVLLSPWTTPAGGTIAGYIASVATTFNSSAGEAFDETWRRRYVRTRVVSNWPAQSGQSAVTHQLLSQHQLSVGGGVGTVQFYGVNQQQGAVPLGDSMDASGSMQIVTGYYDHFFVQAAPAATGDLRADVISIAQELITGEDQDNAGSPLDVPDGYTFVVPQMAQMLWSDPIELEGHSGLQIDGALIEVV